jgi:hypothetical protein
MFRDLFKGIGGVFIVFIFVLLLIVGTWALTVAWAPWKGAGEARKQIQGDGTYRIAAYDKFFRDCADAKTLQDNIKVTKKVIAKARKNGDDGVLQVQLPNLQAQTNQLNALVNSYNADSQRTYTIAQFKSSNLPYTLNAHQEISCGS